MEYTEEELRAIEEAKNQIVECNNLDNLNCFLTDSTTLKILLDLIEKQQKELDKKVIIIKHYKKSCYIIMAGHNNLVDYIKKETGIPLIKYEEKDFLLRGE